MGLLEYNELYPNCDADKPFQNGNGVYDTELDTTECGRDGGDCLLAICREVS